MDYEKLFDYDLWASKRWLPIAEQLGELHVMSHILTSSQVWLGRCKHEEADIRDDLSLDVRFEELRAAWLDFLKDADPCREVFSTNSQGIENTDTIEDIVRHVINHGTYHRGQLRGIAAERRIDFPETDYIAYARKQRAVTAK